MSHVMAEGQYIYFVAPVGGGPIKVGCSIAPINRLRALMTWSPIELELLAKTVGDRFVERAVHARFRDYAIRVEWFEPIAELLTLAEFVRFHGVLPEDILADADRLRIAHQRQLEEQRAKVRPFRGFLERRKPLSHEKYRQRSQRMSAAAKRRRADLGKRRSMQFSVAATDLPPPDESPIRETAAS